MPSAASKLGVFGVSWKSGRTSRSGACRRPVRPPRSRRGYTPAPVLGHADLNDAPARETVRDELGAALPALVDQERVVVGDRLVERQGWLDAVFVEHGEDAENPDPVAVFVVAVAADVGELRLVTAPQPLGASRRAHRERRSRRHLPVPMFEIDDDRQCDPGVVWPAQHRTTDDWRPGIEILIHAEGAFCRHSAAPSPTQASVGSPP